MIMKLNFRELQLHVRKIRLPEKRESAKSSGGNLTSRFHQSHDCLATHCEHTAVQVSLLQRVKS